MLGNLHTADIKLLRTFLIIVRCGGFSAAQAQLNTNQSTISTQMAQLETRLGLRLCERGQGGFRVTPEGMQVVAAAEKVFAVIDGFVDEVNACSQGLRGELKLGISDNVVQNSDCRLADALYRFQQQAPDVQIEVKAVSASELETQIMDGRLHLGLGVFLHHLPHLNYDVLCEEENLLYCGPHHPRFSCDNTDLDPELLEGARLLDWGLRPELPFATTSVHGVNSVDSIVLLLQASDYIAYLPSNYASYWEQRQLLRPLMVAQTRVCLPLNLVSHFQVEQSRLVMALVNCIREAQTSV